VFMSDIICDGSQDRWTLHHCHKNPIHNFLLSDIDLGLHRFLCLILYQSDRELLLCI
jgi:hypothetical protein